MVQPRRSHLTMLSFLQNDCGEELWSIYIASLSLRLAVSHFYSFRCPHTIWSALHMLRCSDIQATACFLHCRFFNVIACNTLFIDMKRHLEPNYIVGNYISLNRCRIIKKKFSEYLQKLMELLKCLISTFLKQLFWLWHQPGLVCEPHRHSHGPKGNWGIVPMHLFFMFLYGPNHMLSGKCFYFLCPEMILQIKLLSGNICRAVPWQVDVKQLSSHCGFIWLYYLTLHQFLMLFTQKNQIRNPFDRGKSLVSFIYLGSR